MAAKKRRIVPFDWADSTPKPPEPATELQPTTTPKPTDRPPADTPDVAVCTAACKYCRAPIQWGQVTEILDAKSPGGRRPGPGEQRWIPLDADYQPHGCRKVASIGDANPAQRAAVRATGGWG